MSKLYHKYPTRELVVLSNRGNGAAFKALISRSEREGLRSVKKAMREAAQPPRYAQQEA